MGIRDRLNQNPGVMFGVVTAIVVAAGILIAVQVLGSRRTFPKRLPPAFFTVDDGKTYFEAAAENVPPFDHEGKQANRAYVFECGGERFVVYVERYNPEAHKAMVENRATPQTQIYGRELKKPGSNKWIKSGDDVGVDVVTAVKCPHGGIHTPEPVEP